MCAASQIKLLVAPCTPLEHNIAKSLGALFLSAEHKAQQQLIRTASCDLAARISNKPSYDNKHSNASIKGNHHSGDAGYLARSDSFKSLDAQVRGPTAVAYIGLIFTLLESHACERHACVCHARKSCM